MQGQPKRSRVAIRALDPVAPMGRQRKMIPRTEIHNPIRVLQRDTGTTPQNKHPCLLYTSDAADE